MNRDVDLNYLMKKVPANKLDELAQLKAAFAVDVQRLIDESSDEGPDNPHNATLAAHIRRLADKINNSRDTAKWRVHATAFPLYGDRFAFRYELNDVTNVMDEWCRDGEQGHEWIEGHVGPIKLFAHYTSNLLEPMPTTDGKDSQ